MNSVRDTFVRRNACACGDPVTCVSDQAVVTQYASTTTGFRNQPREVLQSGKPEYSMSVLLGRLTPFEAFEYVMGRSPTETQLYRALARYSLAGCLRGAGFAVVHTPGRRTRGIHVSIVWPSLDPLDRQDVPWPQGVPEKFDRCFTETSASLG